MSKVLAAWDRGEFEEVAALKLATFKRKDIRKTIRESRYATKLIDLASSTTRVTPLSDFSGNLKVVTVLHSSLPHHTGGYTGRAQGLLKGLLELGIEVRAYTRPGFFTERVDRKASFPFSVDNVDGVTYRHLPAEVPRGRGEYEYMFHCVDWYREVFSIERPNVVHARSTYLIALPAIIAAHQLGIPVLYEVSGLWELVFEGRGQLGKAARVSRMEDLVCENADAIVSMNVSMASLLNERSRSNLEIGLVPNAVDTSRFKSVTPLSDREHFDFDLGYIGSLVDYEGLDILIEAIALGRERGRDLRAKIVGKGVELESLRNIAVQRGVDDLVHFSGPVNADEAPLQFEDVNLVVLPRKSTPATENVTPLKPFEAMAAGRPLVVSDVLALKEVSRQESIAKTFKSGSAEDLLRVILSLLSNRIEQREMVTAATEVVRTEHNWDFVAKTMAENLRKIAVPANPMPYLPCLSSPVRFKNLVFAGRLRNG